MTNKLRKVISILCILALLSCTAAFADGATELRIGKGSAASGTIQPEEAASFTLSSPGGTLLINLQTPADASVRLQINGSDKGASHKEGVSGGDVLRTYEVDTQEGARLAIDIYAEEEIPFQLYAEVKPELQPEPEPEPEPQPEPETKEEAKAEPEPEAAPQPEPEPKEEPQAEPEPEPQLESKAEPEPEPEVEVISEVKQPEPDEEPVAVIVPDPTDAPEWLEEVIEENEPKSENEPEQPETVENTEETEPKEEPKQIEIPENAVVDFEILWDVEIPTLGCTAHFKAVIIGYENFQYTLQWQRSLDCETWEDVEGATEETLDVLMTEESSQYYWRLKLEIME